VDVLPFVGQRDHRLDPKDRVVIPAAFANAIRDHHGGRLYLVPSADVPCIEAYPARTYEQEASQQVPSRFAGDQRGRRLFFHNAEPVDLKGPGRITIPERLRRYFPQGIVRIAGMNTYLELWDPDAWEKHLGDASSCLPLPDSGSGHEPRAE